MQNILLLDIGNTRIKWAIASHLDWLAEGVCEHAGIEDLFNAWDASTMPQAVLGCNVAGDEIAGRISGYWKKRGLPVGWMQASPACCGVRNGYAYPQQLGADRWAALIGAWCLQRQACLVVSCGTAMTIDLLDGEGCFLGGQILPGKRLMFESLGSAAHGLSAEEGQAVVNPSNTADAMTTGIQDAMAGAVERAYRRLESACGRAPACVLTGGDAEWLVGQMAVGCIVEPKLTLIGLRKIAEEREE